jgi:Zn-dependent peptidase ImmA (M78 family)
MMTGFKQFLETHAEEEVKETIGRLPKAHQALLKGYKFKFEGGCTLKGSDENIGMIHLNNDKKKEIHVAAPWNYSRCFTVLHEIGHLVWGNKMTNKLKEKWESIVKNTKEKLNQPAEELFCHAYACHYTGKHCAKVHDHPEWHKFVRDEVPS